MPKIADRIAQIIKDKGISTRAFEMSIGASNGMIGRAVAKNTDIMSEWLSKIIEVYADISPEWLLTGNGPMLRDERPAPAVDPTEQAREIALLKERLADKDEVIAAKDKTIVGNEKLIASLERRVAELEKRGFQERKLSGVPSVDITTT